MNRILKLRKMQRRYGLSRSFRLPEGISLRKPPRPDLNKLIAGETQYLVLSPTLVFGASRITRSTATPGADGQVQHSGRRWHMFKLGLLATAIIMVVFPVDWLPNLLLFKFFTVLLLGLSLFASFFYGHDWAKSRLGGIILGCAFIGGLLGLLIGPSQMGVGLKLLAVTVLAVLFYPDKEAIPARFARRIGERYRRNRLASAVAYTERHGLVLRLIFGSAAVIALVLTFSTLNLLVRLALVALLVLVELIFVGSAIDQYRSETLETFFLAMLKYGGLAVALAAWPSDWRVIVFKVVVLAAISLWFGARWVGHCELARIVFYSYDNFDWSIHTFTAGWRKKDSVIEWAKIGDLNFTAASAISKIFQLGNGDPFADSPGSELNASLQNVAHAEEMVQMSAAFKRRGTGFERQGAAGQRRSAIMFQVNTGLSREQVLGILPGELYAADYLKLATEGIIGEARKALILNALEQGKSWDQINAEWKELKKPEYPEWNSVGVLEEICLNLVLSAHNQGLSKQQIEGIYPDPAFGRAYQRLVDEGVIRPLVNITTASPSN